MRGGLGVVPQINTPRNRAEQRESDVQRLPGETPSHEVIGAPIDAIM